MLRKYLGGLALVVVALALIGCDDILTSLYSVDGQFPGLNTPLTVDGVEIEVRSVEVSNGYDSVGATVNANSPDQEVVAVNVGAVSQDDVLEMFDWPITLTIDGGTPVEAITVATSITTNPERKRGTVIWVFRVPVGGKTFILNLPDGQTIDVTMRVSRKSAK